MITCCNSDEDSVVSPTNDSSQFVTLTDAVRHFAIYRKVCIALFIIALLLFYLDGKRRCHRHN